MNPDLSGNIERSTFNVEWKRRKKQNTEEPPDFTSGANNKNLCLAAGADNKL